MTVLRTNNGRVDTGQVSALEQVGQKPVDRVKVIYISGFWRSGSTILTRILGECSETFAAGEIQMIWDHSLIGSAKCGCGLSLHDCSTWRQVMSLLADELGEVNLYGMPDQLPRTRHLPAMILPTGEAAFARRYAAEIAILDGLYRAIAAATDSRVIVDSSKLPHYGFLLGLAPSVDLYVLHLVRDARGAEYSILRRRQGGDPRFKHHSVAKSSFIWSIVNLSQELLAGASGVKYMRMRYEDFVRDPNGCLQRILGFIGEPDLEAPAIQDGCIELGVNHTANGSNSRFETGPVQVRLDDKWRKQMATRDRSLVTVLTLPLLRHYGYI